MVNVAVAEDLAGAEELDELYQLDASESGPEEGEDFEEDEEDKDEGIEPEVMPQG